MTACPRCDAPTTVDEVAETAMQAGDVVVRVAGLARVRCSSGHTTLLPSDAAAAARGAVDDRLLSARTRGVVRRRDVCGACEAELVLLPVRTERAAPVDVAGRVLTVTVGAPMARCPDCGREQLVPSAAAVVHDVVDAAVSAADA